MAKDFRMTFPENYPELLEHMGQAIARRLVALGVDKKDVPTWTFSIVEDIRSEVGGGSVYLSKGTLYELSLRDEKIYNEFKGNNYFQLAHKYGLTEMQIRTIVNRGRERDRARKQSKMFDDDGKVIG